MTQQIICKGCQGVLVQLDAGLYHAHDGSLGCKGDDGIVYGDTITTTPECDLCSKPGKWDREIRVPRISMSMLDDAGYSLTVSNCEQWAVCDECEVDLASPLDAPSKILDRCADRMVERVGLLPREFIVREIREIHRVLWSQWDGKVYDHEA